jgi:hypothetical protein
MESLGLFGALIVLFFGLIYLIAPISVMIRLSKLNSQADQIIAELRRLSGQAEKK